MKVRLHLAAVGALVLMLGCLVVLTPIATGRGTWTALTGVSSKAGEGAAASFVGSAVSVLKGQTSTGSWRTSRTHALDQSAASPSTEYVSQQATLISGTTGVAVATCPSGSIAVGGGYEASPDVTFYTQFMSGNGWRGDAKNNSTEPKEITVFAVCLSNVSGVYVSQAHGQVDVPAGTKGQAVATCPAGSIATGGGFHAYPDGSLQVYNSSKADADEGWQSWARNLSGSTKTHHAYAVCVSGTGGSTVRILDSTKAPPAGTGAASPQCELGSLITSGGYAAQADLLIYSTSGPHPGRAWLVFVKNTNPSDERTLFGYATCLSLPGQLIVHTQYLPRIERSHAP